MKPVKTCCQKLYDSAIHGYAGCTATRRQAKNRSQKLSGLVADEATPLGKLAEGIRRPADNEWFFPLPGCIRERAGVNFHLHEPAGVLFLSRIPPRVPLAKGRRIQSDT